MKSTKHLLIRQELLKAIRQFFSKQDYCEIQTPYLVPDPGAETYLRYFETKYFDHKSQATPLWLRSSPELSLKKVLMTSDLKKVFEIGPCFRNHGESGPWHRPEFTMLEWYEVSLTYEDMMEQSLRLIQFCNDHLNESFGLKTNQWTQTAKKFTVAEAFKEFSDIELIDEDEGLSQKARERGIHSVNITDDFETSFFKILIDRIEPELQKLPLAFLYDYPASQSALARTSKGVAKRFEIYMHGIEICNAFDELTGLEEHLEFLQNLTEKRQTLGLEQTAGYKDFLETIQANPLPRCCGNALGVDRLEAVFMGWTQLQD